jgi:hypothetical protein
MKQLLSLFLFLLPCLVWAQYPSNGNQKITLGEQTTADGLIYRGVASIDTVTGTSKITRVNKQDTSAFLLLDTTTNLLWHYKTASNGWLQAGGSTLDTATMLLPYWRSGRFSGVLPVANGGTGQTTLAAAGINTGSGTLNFIPKYTATGTTFGNSSIFDNGNVGINQTTLFTKFSIANSLTPTTVNDYNPGILNIQNTNTTNGNLSLIGFQDASAFINLAAIGAINEIHSSSVFNVRGSLAFYTKPINVSNVSEKMRITSTGNVGIGIVDPEVQFHTTGAVRFATFAGGGTTTLDVDNTGNLARTSSIELKKDITPISYGLNQILQINPINFNWINEDEYGNENENGFIAEDVMNIIPNVVGSDAHGLFMDYKKLIPILTKAIQEQNLLIKSLEQRIINLENK